MQFRPFRLERNLLPLGLMSVAIFGTPTAALAKPPVAAAPSSMDAVTSGQTCNRLLKDDPATRKKIEENMAKYLKENESCVGDNKKIAGKKDADLRKVVGEKNDKNKPLTVDTIPSIDKARNARVAVARTANQTADEIKEAGKLRADEWAQQCALAAKENLDLDINVDETDWRSKHPAANRGVALRNPKEDKDTCPPTADQRSPLTRAYDYNKMMLKSGAPVINMETDSYCACHPTKSKAGARELARQLEALPNKDDKAALYKEVTGANTWERDAAAEKKAEIRGWIDAPDRNATVFDRDTRLDKWSQAERDAWQRAVSNAPPMHLGGPVDGDGDPKDKAKSFEFRDPDAYAGEFKKAWPSGTNPAGSTQGRWIRTPAGENIHIWQFCDKNAACYWTYGGSIKK